MLGEDRRDRLVLALLDQLVDVDGAPVEAARQRARHRALAGAHEADEIDLVRFHATSRCERLEEARVRDRDGVGAFDARRVRGGERGDRKRHGHAVIAVGVGDAARGRAASRGSTKPSGRSSASMPSAAKAGDQRRDAVALLDAQLRRRRGR